MDVYERYTAWTKCNLSNKDFYKVGDGLYRSLINDVSLAEFTSLRLVFCGANHRKGCVECQKLVDCANDILSHGVTEVKPVFTKNFQESNYISNKAIRRMMQMHVVVFTLKPRGAGSQRLFVTENNPDVDYSLFVKWFEKVIPMDNINDGLAKDQLQALCSLATTEKDRKLVKLAACQSRCLSGKNETEEYGVDSLKKLKEEVEAALSQTEEIKNAVTELARVEEKATLEALGIYMQDERSEEDVEEVEVEVDWESDESELICEEGSEFSKQKGLQNGLEEKTNHEVTCIMERQGEEEADLPRIMDGVHQDMPNLLDPDTLLKQQAIVSPVPSTEALVSILRGNNLNWFSFVGELQILLANYSPEVLHQALLDFAHELTNTDLTHEEEEKIEQSRQAFLALHRTTEECEVESSSESDNPDDWVGVRDILSEKGKELVMKQRKIFQKKRRRKIAKEVANRHILKRKVPPKVCRTVCKFPNIGKDIGDFVEERRVGADQWRRTGVFTFDGNQKKKGRKVTYRRIQEYLNEKYNAEIGYGTIVQLCTVRNKRKLSASRYHGVARVTSRRARKGFTIKLNPDAHYSTSMYKGLDYIQLKDGRDKMVLNRDDQAGFRLDTTCTHKLHKATSLTDEPETTTRTDYVNKYASTIQTTSVMFLGTSTTSERCVGVVKAQQLYKTNPAQHASDLVMLESKEELAPWMKNKAVDCIRVGGAGDEGPSHHEVQFHWTERNFMQGKVATLVTTRHSGGSYLNRDEMQNGCLALAHSNLFIPSTLMGPNITGEGLDTDRLSANLDVAIDVYIDRVNGAPCGKSEITLYKGAKDDYAKKLQDRRQDLLTFLKGSKKMKADLKEKKPGDYEYFENIWDIRNRHMVNGLPQQYVFYLVPCYESDCVHPVCKRGRPQLETTWFEDGPSLHEVPFPIPDPAHP